MPWPYHQRSWQVLGPGVVLGVSMKEDKPWLGGGGLFILTQGLRVQPRHRLRAYLDLSLGYNHEDQNAMECGGLGRKVDRGKGGSRNNCPNDTIYLALHALLV